MREVDTDTIQEPLPGYRMDEWGLYRDDSYGRWRTVATDDEGHLIAAQPWPVRDIRDIYKRNNAQFRSRPRRSGWSRLRF